MLPKRAEESGQERGGGEPPGGGRLPRRVRPRLRPPPLCRSGPGPRQPHPHHCSFSAEAVAPPGCSPQPGSAERPAVLVLGQMRVGGQLSSNLWHVVTQEVALRDRNRKFQDVLSDQNRPGPSCWVGAELRAGGRLAHQDRLRAAGGSGRGWTRLWVLNRAEPKHQTLPGLCECRSQVLSGPTEAEALGWGWASTLKPPQGCSELGVRGGPDWEEGGHHPAPRPWLWRVLPGLCSPLPGSGTLPAGRRPSWRVSCSWIGHPHT